MRALLVPLLALSAARSVHGATSCADCAGEICILDGSATAVTGGATSLVLNLCNFDADAVDASAVSFGALYPLACDADNATLPTAATLQAADGCTADACAVTVTFARGLDWALALHGSSGVNALTASLSTDGGASAAVTVATFQDVAGAAMTGSSASVSVCATAIPISASRLSLVDECNVASLCQGAAGDTACTTALQEDLLVTDVSCEQEACSGNVTLASALPCDGATASAAALIVSVQVATSTASNYLSVGSMAAANFSVSAVDGLVVGSSEIALTTDTFCDATSVELSLAYADTSVGNSVATIDVTSVNTSASGAVVIELGTPLASSLEGEDVTFSLSQCGVSASAFTAMVGAGSGSADEEDEDDSASSSTAGSDASSADDADSDAGGGYSAQETGTSAGLSGGLYVGIGIGVIALLGFLGECYMHKRRQAQQPSTADPANAPIGYANTM